MYLTQLGVENKNARRPVRPDQKKEIKNEKKI